MVHRYEDLGCFHFPDEKRVAPYLMRLSLSDSRRVLAAAREVAALFGEIAGGVQWGWLVCTRVLVYCTLQS